MVSSVLTSFFALVAIANAAAIAIPSTLTTLKGANIISANTTKQFETSPFDAVVNPTVLQSDQVLLYGKGRVQVVHKSVYEAMLKEDALFNVDTPTPNTSFVGGFLNGTIINGTEIIADAKQTTPINSRCTFYKAIQVQKTDNFLDWDVPMSSVIRGDASGRTTVSISSGHSVSNAVAVTANAKWAIVKDLLEASVSISYTRTWSTTYTAAYTFGVKANKWGVIVSNPRTTRRYGRLLEGCVGSMQQTSTFQADQRYQGSYDGLNWVQGAISLCERFSYPVGRCNGGGHIY